MGGTVEVESTSADRFAQEIHRLHNFFVDWFKGDIDETEQNFSVCVESMAECFHLVTPQGLRMERESLLASLKEAYGCRKGTIFNIECRNVKVLHSIGDAHLVAYEEWQTIGETKTARISSSWFREDPKLPNQLQWLHVHETWIPGMGPPSSKEMWNPENEGKEGTSSS